MTSARRAAVLLLLLVLILSSCGGKQKQMGDGDLLQIGDEIFTKQEAMVFLLSQHTIYAGEYGEEIWNVQLSEGSFETYVKKAMLDYLERLFLTDCAARADGIALSITENAAAEKAAEDRTDARTLPAGLPPLRTCADLFPQGAWPEFGRDQ